MSVIVTAENYETERDKLIPFALQHTISVVGERPDGTENTIKWNAKWNREFFATMNRLMVERMREA